MMGSACPKMFVSITRKFQAGDVGADDLFAANLPILRYEQHSIVGPAIGQLSVSASIVPERLSP
ncbi:hypothetical protein [Microvirga massiliensis]|uniref:hypothetical protein n=1 Tax=Microvirga massiliensis TaxID=1033741 RepID=UPI0012E1520E|nr:hypothetical protein [Microvirga massiliensis]